MLRDKWREVGARIDAISLRERVFVFAAAAAVALALVQVLLIDAGNLRKQNAQTRLQGADDALAHIAQQRQQLAAQAGRDPDRAVRDALTAQEARLAELNAELEKLERSLISPERMNQVLKSVVQGTDSVRVVGFRTLAPQAVALPDAAEGAPPGFYRHGFELSLSGRYADLVAYLERLEALPWRLSWSEATLDAAGRPQLTLTLRVHTLSLEEAWLRV
jgi:MSHA biogenesis protein MshJ